MCDEDTLIKLGVCQAWPVFYIQIKAPSNTRVHINLECTIFTKSLKKYL